MNKVKICALFGFFLLFIASTFAQASTELEEITDFETFDVEDETPTNPYLNEHFQRILKVVIIDFPNDFSTRKSDARPPTNNRLGLPEPTKYNVVAEFLTALDSYIQGVIGSLANSCCR
jgi:hypothetical protein